MSIVDVFVPTVLLWAFDLLVFLMSRATGMRIPAWGLVLMVLLAATPIVCVLGRIAIATVGSVVVGRRPVPDAVVASVDETGHA